MLYCFAETPCFFCSKSKIDWRTQFFQVNFPNFFSLLTLIGGLTHLTEEFCKKTKNHSNSKRKLWRKQKRKITEKKTFSKEKNSFPQKFSLEAPSFVLWTPKKTFRLKARRRLKSYSFFKKKCYSSKPCKGT